MSTARIVDEFMATGATVAGRGTFPVLFGQGRRLFEGLAPEHELQRIRILEGEDGVTHMHYRVQR